MFKNSANPNGKLFLPDGDPSQNSKIACETMDSVRCRLLKIPPCFPDINPIENMFHLIEKQLKKDAITQNLEHETYQKFSRRDSFEFSTRHYQQDNQVNAKTNRANY